MTERQLEVAGLVAEGLTNREIAERLFISEATVKEHAAHIYSRLGYDLQQNERGRVRLALEWSREHGT